MYLFLPGIRTHRLADAPEVGLGMLELIESKVGSSATVIALDVDGVQGDGLARVYNCAP